MAHSSIWARSALAVRNDGVMSGGERADGQDRRPLQRATVGWPGSLRELKDLLYEAYLGAGNPSLDAIAANMADNDALVNRPTRDAIRYCISDAQVPPVPDDMVAVAITLARLAGWNWMDLAARVRKLWAVAQLATPAGRPIGEFDSRLVLRDLEVHPALHVDSVVAGGFSGLPAYVPRAFDAQLNSEVAAAASSSGIVVLVGGSSTGKTRACWEAVKALPAEWRVWHPIDPTRPDAALAELDNIAPRTVVWLNDADLYLAQDQLGEQVAAGLRNLLRSPERGPVLVLATLWREPWDTLTTRDTLEDPHAHARELLDGPTIEVPDAFTEADHAALADAADADPRIAEAATQAEDGQITQYLAGVPVLMKRYRAAGPATKALIHAAMDARRLGAGPHLPLALLAAAAPGYLTDTEWTQTQAAGDWLGQALDYLTTPCNGIPGILTPITAERPRNQRSTSVAGVASRQPNRAGQGPLYQLADYLHQHGQRHRADQIPPIDFWTATAAYAHPTDLFDLAGAAWKCRLYRDAIQLRKHATANGDPRAALRLIDEFGTLHAGTDCAAQWAVTHVGLHDLLNVTRLLTALHKIEAREQVTILAQRAAHQTSFDDPAGVARLLNVLREVGARDEITALLNRNPAHHTHLNNLGGVASLLEALREIETGDSLREALWEDRPQEQRATLSQRAAAKAPLKDLTGVLSLLRTLHKTGAREQVSVLAQRAAHQTNFDDPAGVARLLDVLREVGARDEITALLNRNPAHHTHLNNLGGVASLLEALREIEVREQRTTRTRRPTLRAPHFDPTEVPTPLEVKAREQIDTLTRQAATKAPLNDPTGVPSLLEALREVKAGEQLAILARRAATDIPLNYPSGVAYLLRGRYAKLCPIPPCRGIDVWAGKLAGPRCPRGLGLRQGSAAYCGHE